MTTNDDIDNNRQLTILPYLFVGLSFDAWGKQYFGEQSNFLFMKPVDRDLLILLHEDRYTEQQIQSAVRQISEMLSLIETMDYLCAVMEVMDCNKSRITSKRTVLEKAISRKSHKPFEFIIHKN